MISILTRIYRRLAHSIAEASLDAVPKMFVFGVVAVGGFPLYHYVWSSLFPQPYESLGLRLTCAAIAAPLLFTKYWPQWMRAILPSYWFLVLTLCLPLFFTYMLLQNGVDSIWPMASVAAVLLLFLVVNSLGATVMWLIGAVTATAVFTLVEGNTIPWADYIDLLPVYAFTLVAGASFNLTNERQQRTRSLAAHALGGHVAHELGNPLATISMGARSTKEYSPALIAAYRSARDAGLEVEPISESQLEFLSKVGRVTELEVDYSLMIIDMMLRKAGAVTADSYEHSEFNAIGCVHESLSRYAFKSSDEKECIRVASESDFTVYANETLFRHVLFNLVKNGLYAIKAARRRGRGKIQIWAVPGQRTNRLHIRDNGIGMSPETLAQVFDPFFTTRDKGTGLGLHFCRDVMRRFGGEIACESSEGYFTEFVLSFPASRRVTVPISASPPEPDGPIGEDLLRQGTNEARWQGEAHASPRLLA